MKALSIKQPWASLIAHGIKDIENRTWKTHFRGRIYIHASAKSVVKWEKFTSILDEKQLCEVLKDEHNLNANSFPTSVIIGEVDIIDCVINHESIWAEKMEIHICEETGIQILNKNQKYIWNWVLANPVLYDKPILNVKGKLSFWKWEGCEQTCESCEKDFDMETMQRDGDDNFFCLECAHGLFPLMQKEYEEMVAKGEIDSEDD